MLHGVLVRLVAAMIISISLPLSAHAADVASGLQIAGGEQHMCFLDSEGVKCFRRIPFTQNFVSDEPITEAACARGGSGACLDELSRVAPSFVDGPRPVRIVAGGNNTCALTALGQVYCWGANRRINAEVPVFSRQVWDLAVTWDRACARTDQGIVCWGHDRSCLTSYGSSVIGHEDEFGPQDLRLHLGGGASCLHARRPNLSGSRIVEGYSCGLCTEPTPGHSDYREFIDDYTHLATSKDYFCVIHFRGEIACDQYAPFNYHFLNGNTYPYDLVNPTWLGMTFDMIYAADAQGLKYVRLSDVLDERGSDFLAEHVVLIPGTEDITAWAAGAGLACGAGGPNHEDLVCVGSPELTPQILNIAAAPRPVFLAFDVRGAAASLRHISQYLYASKAAIVSDASSLLAGDDPADEDVYAYTMLALQPLLESVTTEYFSREVTPRFDAAIRRIQSTYPNLGAVPHTPVVIDASLQLFAASVKALEAFATGDDLNALEALRSRAVLLRSTSASDLTSLKQDVQASQRRLEALAAVDGAPFVLMIGVIAAAF